MVHPCHCPGFPDGCTVMSATRIVERRLKTTDLPYCFLKGFSCDYKVEEHTTAKLNTMLKGACGETTGLCMYRIYNYIYCKWFFYGQPSDSCFLCLFFPSNLNFLTKIRLDILYFFLDLLF